MQQKATAMDDSLLPHDLLMAARVRCMCGVEAYQLTISRARNLPSYSLLFPLIPFFQEAPGAVWKAGGAANGCGG